MPFPRTGSDPGLHSAFNGPAHVRRGALRRLPIQNPRPVPVTPNMTAPPRQLVVPPGEDLLHPLHYPWQRQSVIWLDVKTNSVGFNAEAPDLEGEADHSLIEDLEEKNDSPRLTEEGFPVVDAGAHFIPDAPGKFTCL